MFESLSQSLSAILDKIKLKGVISEADIEASMREIRIALLKSDVTLSVIKNFIDIIKIRAKGVEVIKNVTPGQMIVKIVHEELTKILGGDDTTTLRSSSDSLTNEKVHTEINQENKLFAQNQNQELNQELQNQEFSYLGKLDNVLSNSKFNMASEINLNGSPACIMLIGLQGSGKTTSAVKLGYRISKYNKKKVLIASVDVYRPAAQVQLQMFAKSCQIDTLQIIADEKPIDICKRALSYASLNNYEVVIIDTAGRLQTNADLMLELKTIKSIISPTEILFVSDAMIGQEAINIVQEFNNEIQITGIILTRTDSDAKGGAALGMKMSTGCNIKYIGIGEKPADLEVFHPERAASRILGMGDIVSLVEKAGNIINEDEARKIAIKLDKGSMDMNDLLQQIKTIKKMSNGNISSILGMIPGFSQIKDKIGQNLDNDLFAIHESIIQSMTLKERKNPELIKGKRKQRLALGSGRKIENVNNVLKMHQNMKNMMKDFKKMDVKKLMSSFK